MYRFLTSKKGYTMVELLIVLALLSLGAVAMINLFKVAYRAFEKSEERYIKQEAVKTVAELLKSGSTSVAAAQTADIFDTVDVVPAGSAVDESYSYLFALPAYQCKGCFEELKDDTPCKKEECVEKGAEPRICGYYLYIQDKGKDRSNAKPISDIPIFMDIEVYKSPSYEGGPVENQCGVKITLAALEDDFEYTGTKEEPLLSDIDSDYIYYSLDVAYHFPNMVTSDSGVTVNYIKKGQPSTADLYDQKSGANQKEKYMVNGIEKTRNVSVEAKDEGIVLRVYADSILKGDNTNTSVAVPKFCFIATASYGYDSGEVGLLCEFRDKCLRTNPVGEAFVKAYYKISPPIAEIIADNDGLKSAVRVMLKPVVVVAMYALDGDISDQGVAWLLVLLASGVGATGTVVVFRKRKRKV